MLVMLQRTATPTVLMMSITLLLQTTSVQIKYSMSMRLMRRGPVRVILYSLHLCTDTMATPYMRPARRVLQPVI